MNREGTNEVAHRVETACLVKCGSLDWEGMRVAWGIPGWYVKVERDGDRWAEYVPEEKEGELLKCSICAGYARVGHEAEVETFGARSEEPGETEVISREDRVDLVYLEGFLMDGETKVSLALLPEEIVSLDQSQGMMLCAHLSAFVGHDGSCNVEGCMGGGY
jgi:hypothetical protein